MDSQYFLENSTNCSSNYDAIRKECKLGSIESCLRTEWDEYELRKEYDDIERELTYEIPTEEPDDTLDTNEHFSLLSAIESGYKYVKCKEYLDFNRHSSAVFVRFADTIESVWIEIPKDIYEDLDCNHIIIELIIGGTVFIRQSLTSIILNLCLHDEGIMYDESDDMYRIKIIPFENYGKYGLPMIKLHWHQIELKIHGIMNHIANKDVRAYWYGYAFMNTRDRANLARDSLIIAMVDSVQQKAITNTNFCLSHIPHICGAIILTTESNCDIEEVALTVILDDGTKLLPWIFTDADMLQITINTKKHYIVPFSPEYSKFEGIQDKANEQNIHGVFLNKAWDTIMSVRTYYETSVECELIGINYVRYMSGMLSKRFA